jgi:cytochrome c nitrite reductase small subunit
LSLRSDNVPLILLAILLGLAIGISGFTFIYAKGASYLTDQPEACANCHVMQEQLTGWIASSHRQAAVCNDCHTPKNFIGKYLSKFANGIAHSWAFTTGWFHEPISIKSHNFEITENRCRDCHRDITDSIDAGHPGGQALGCIRCHGDVGHPR